MTLRFVTDVHGHSGLASLFIHLLSLQMALIISHSLFITSSSSAEKLFIFLNQILFLPTFTQGLVVAGSRSCVYIHGRNVACAAQRHSVFLLFVTNGTGQRQQQPVSIGFHVVVSFVIHHQHFSTSTRFLFPIVFAEIFHSRP